MTKDKLLEHVSKNTGKPVSVLYKTVVPLTKSGKKAFDIIQKLSYKTFIIGKSYSESESFKARHGDSKTAGALPWGKWVPGYENILLEYNGRYYLRVIASKSLLNKDSKYLATDKTGSRFLQKEELSGFVPDSYLEKPEKKDGDVFNIKLENVVDIF